MKISLKITNMLRSIKNSIRRFPITILVSTALVIMLIILREGELIFTSVTKDIIIRVIMILAIGIPLSVNIKFIFEKMKGTNLRHLEVGYIIGAIALIIYYFIFLDEINWISIARYLGISICLYLAFFYIPWIKKKEGYEYYIIDVLTSFIITVVYSLVLFLGIVIIVFTIEQLFNINLPYDTILYSFYIIAGIFAPSLFLAKIPIIEGENYKIEYPKSSKVLLLYIVIPLITIYTLILYAYFVKIIVTRDWPQGLVSHLVMWYSVLSVAVIFFITPILEENKWAYRFRTLFPKFILPILAMMFVAMGIRINEYAITENRYFGLLLGLWVLGIMLYFIFKKRLKNIIIPISLSILVLIAVFGPLSGFNISKISQNNRFESILEANQMLEADEIKANSNISKDDKEEISMILKYFKDRHSLDDVKYISDDFNMNDMNTVFGFSYTEKNVYEHNYFSYYINNEDRIAIDVKDYDYFIDNMSFNNGIVELEDVNISYNYNKTVIIKKDSEILYEKNLIDFVNEIFNNNEDAQLNVSNELNLEDAIFIDENDNVKVKFIIQNISGHKENDENIIDYIEYYILVKIK